MGRRAIESGRGSRGQSRLADAFYIPVEGGFVSSDRDDWEERRPAPRRSSPPARRGGSTRVPKPSRQYAREANWPRRAGVALALGLGALLMTSEPESGDLTSRAVFPSATKAQETVSGVAKYVIEQNATAFGAQKDANGNIIKFTSLGVPVGIEYPDKNKLKEIDPMAKIDKPEDLPPVHAYISFMCKYPDANAYQAPLKQACIEDLVAIVDEAMKNPLDYEAPAKAAFLDIENDKVPKENVYTLKPCGTLDDDPNKINVYAYGIKPGPEPIEKRRIELTCE